MNLFEVVKASINAQEAAQAYGIDVNHMAWRCVRSTTTVIRAYMYRMTTTTVSPVGSMGM